MFLLKLRNSFHKGYKKLTKGNSKLQKQFAKALKLIEKNPFYPSLKTHKVDTKNYTKVYSSSVNGDVRIIWNFDEDNNLVILLLETGTHSGANQIYKKKSS